VNLPQHCYSYDKVREQFGILHNEELRDLYSPSRGIRWAVKAASMGETRNEYRILVGKPLVRYPFGRPKRILENINMDLTETGCEDWRWMKLNHCRVQ